MSEKVLGIAEPERIMGTPARIPCPDCRYVAASRQEFVLHRERRHYGERISVSGVGNIRSQEAHGYQPAPDHEE